MHNRRLFYILLCAVLLSALTLMLCSAALGIGRYDAVPLQTAGSSEVLPDHTVRFAILLPEEARREHMVFCFRCYNCVVRVLDGETLLLSSGADRVAAGRPIGHMLLSVPVPEDAWGRELTVLAAAQDGTDTASISSPALMSASDARLYPLLNKQFDFLIFLPVTLLSLAAVPIFAVLWAFRFRFGKRGFCLSMFLFLTGCWYLGFQGLLWAFSERSALCANLEYYALFTLPIPFLGYLRQEHLPPRSKKLLLGIELAFALLAAAATVLTLLPGGYSYLNLTNFLRILILLALVVSMAVIYMARGQNRRASERVLRNGLIATMAIAAVETARIALHIDMQGALNFTRLMLLVFLATLLTSFLLREYRSLRTRLEREQLQRLAYTDILTGIPNRQDLERHAEELSAQEAGKSAVLFFDANGLKKANDEFGHAAGDAMLREVGQALARAMEKSGGFYGRYGGDEFAACVPAAQAEEIRSRFCRELDRVNREQRLPFEISVACGISAWADYRGRPDMSMSTLIRLADEKMYRNKQEMKACRQA